ncbi:hypothetical protein ACIBO9_28385 [Streptomyces prunicolor]|uniref:hypothetical protein n=1 Tax=Streptomyces prunicolor TaxID=67348 RepID=UPI0037D3B6CB
MNDALTNLIIPTALGIVIGECTEISPWLARRILRFGARLLGTPEAAERYEAEWVALLDERPGKLLKLFFACWIALRGTWTLRSIHRPSVSASESPPNQAAESRAEAPPEPLINDSLHGQPHQQFADEREGVYVTGHDRRPGRLGRSSQRRRPWVALSVLILVSWIPQFDRTPDSSTEFVATSVARPSLGCCL